MTIGQKQFLAMNIQGVIFHDVPRNNEAAAPILADVETDFDVPRTKMLKDKLVAALGSSRAYAIEFDAGSSSKVPDAIAAMTKKGSSKAAFIKNSQDLATFLFAEHAGNVSPGLMCVVDVREGGRRGIAMMKLEREAGAQLEPKTTADGKKSFELSLIDNLVFTEGTKLFKAGLFMRTSEDPPEFEALACDSQLAVASVSSMARFWLRFLGVKFVTEPRVATKQFFEVALKAITDLIDDPIDKAQVFGALHSELTSNEKIFSPKSFVEKHLPEQYRVAFQTRLKERHIGLHQFMKDSSDILPRLKRRLYETARGVSISVSEEDASLVEVKARQVVVNDELLMVK
jgi:hypothetical protein